MVGHEGVASQDSAQEVQIWCTSYPDYSGSIGVPVFMRNKKGTFAKFSDCTVGGK
jgi:hypothetical protein